MGSAVTETVTYAELARRVGDIFMVNKIPEIDDGIWDNLQNGTLYDGCDWFINNAKEPSWCCDSHMYDGTFDYPATGDHPSECDFAEPLDIYQWYLIPPSGAQYLKDVSDELVFYSDVLDEYVWGITHFGTSWEYVTTQIGAL